MRTPQTWLRLWAPWLAAGAATLSAAYAWRAAGWWRIRRTLTRGAAKRQRRN